MIGYLGRTLLCHFRQGRTLYILTLLGIALGVAAVLCIQILNRNALAAFRGTVAAVSSQADLSVTGVLPDLDETVLPRVLAQRETADAWPLVRLDAALDGEERLFLEIIGVDFTRPVPLLEGRREWEAGAALSRPGWVAVTSALARQMGWTVGSRIRVSSGGRRADLEVGALLDLASLSPLASRKLALMDIAQAQSLLGSRGRIQQIDLKLREGVDAERFKEALEKRVGPGVRVQTPDQRLREVKSLLAAFRLNLTALSLVSLFVGLFLVHTSTLASLVRRRAEFGVLRCLGATRAQVLGLILGEVALLGVLGVLIGVPVGYGLARANVHTVSRTLSSIYLLAEIEQMRLPAWLVVLAAAVGIGGAASGSLPAALEMSRDDPRTLLAPYTLHERAGWSAPRQAAWGLLLLAGASLWAVGPGRDWKPAGFVLGVALLVALPLSCPLAIREACRHVRVGGFGLGFSLRTLAQRLQTTSFAVAALTVAVSMLVGMTLMIGSFRSTLEQWLETTMQADLYVSSPSVGRPGGDAALGEAMVRELVAFPGVRYADRLRRLRVYARERRITLSGVDMSLPGGEKRFSLVDSGARAALEQVRGAGAVLISEPLSRKSGLGRGDRLTVRGPRGDLVFPIAGVYRDYASENGAAITALSTLEAAFGPGDLTSLALYLEPGRNLDRVAAGLKAAFPRRALRIQTYRALRGRVMALFDQTFAITRILQVMSLVIAATGITLTLLVLARERVAELALYRALGARRGQVFRIFVGEGMAMAAVGLCLGAAGGVMLALILVRIINRAYFGWTIQMHWPWGMLAGQAAVILAASLLASIYPALRAAQAPATELSRENVF